MRTKGIMIIAGEASGDMHGAMLAAAIRQSRPGIRLFGVGGSAMQAAGVDRIIDAKTLSVVGITEVFSKLPAIYRSLVTVRKALKRLRPDLLIVIDFPDFNFRAAAIAKRLGIPVLYYISPQLWAWRQGRVKTIKRLVDHVAVILPFEADFYRKHRVPVTFVGHPLLDRIPSQTARAPDEPTPTAPTIGLLPGSRDKEVCALLPAMLEAARIIRTRLPSAKFLVSCAESVDAALVADLVGRHAPSLPLEIVDGPVSKVFAASRLLVAASGTVTLEAGLYGIPTIIVYRVSPLSFWLGKRLVKVKHIGLVNLIVKGDLLPELIQDDANPQTIAETAVEILSDPEIYARMKKALLGVRTLLGGAGASHRVADIALRLIQPPGV